MSESNEERSTLLDNQPWKGNAEKEQRNDRKGRHAPPVRMIKLTERQEITRYKWVHPSEQH
jgi:hypothetical protein